MEYKNYKVVVRNTWHNEGLNKVEFEDKEEIIPVPRNVTNIDGFLNYFLGVTNRDKSIAQKVISWDEIEEVVLDKFSALANNYPDEAIWTFLSSKGITKDNLINFMEPKSTINGCSNSYCERQQENGEQRYYGLELIGYSEEENKFYDIENLSDEEMDCRGIEALDYFDIYYCPVCNNLEHYIE